MVSHFDIVSKPYNSTLSRRIDMSGIQSSGHTLNNGKTRIELETLGPALRHCFDLTFLQNSNLTRLPSVMRRCREERQGLDRARVLQRKLIAAFYANIHHF